MQSDDYHSDINSELFEGWLKKQLPKLDQNSILVMDNASYHSAKDEENAPKQAWRKERLANWLRAKNIEFDPKSKKDHIWELAREKAKSEPRYRVDDIIREAGHQVVRLPPYHCDLNPIGNFLFQVSKIKFRYQNRKLKCIRIPRANYFGGSLLWV